MKIVGDNISHTIENLFLISSQLKNMGVENWMFLKENDCYVASDKGDVFRVCRRQKSKSGRLINKYEALKLKGSFDRYGYKTYRITVDGKKKHLKGHRIVLNAFVENTDNKPCVNHLDGNKSNNNISNLEWVTVAENNSHAIKTGLLDFKKIDYSHKTVVKTYDYLSIYLLNKKCNFPRKKIAEMNNCSRQTIDKVIRRVHNLLLRVGYAES